MNRKEALEIVADLALNSLITAGPSSLDERRRKDEAIAIVQEMALHEGGDVPPDGVEWPIGIGG